MSDNKKDKKFKINCECPLEGFVPKCEECEYSEEEKSGMNHKPNKCPCRNELSLYERDGKRIWLCSCCHMFDKFIRKATKKELFEVEE